MIYECWSRVRDFESGELRDAVLESRRTDKRAAHEDAALLRMFGKRTEVVEVEV